MNSRMIGEANLRLRETELDAMLHFTGENEDYSEFHFGDWKTFVIWNQSGEPDDGMVFDHGLAGRPTSRATVLPGLIEWINTTFDISTLKLGRIHSLGDGVLIPHRDFVEFGRDVAPWTRVHVPLLTNEQCLHSEDDTVFRMRPGEIWFLDASNLHSAINLSANRRLNLCLDFALEGRPIESIFLKPEHAVATRRARDIVTRPPLDASFRDELQSIAASLTENKFRDVVGYLAKIHFRRRVHINRFFEWLAFVADHAQQPSLREKAARYSRFLRAERDMGQRFDIGA